MESTNLHRHHHHRHHQHHENHQLQDQLDASSTSSSSIATTVTTTPSWYLPSNNLNAWTLNSHSLNTTNYFNNDNFDEESLSSNARDARQKIDLFDPPPADLSSNNSINTTSTTTNTSMMQDLGFQYWTSTTNNTDHHQSDCYPKFTEMLSSSATAEDQFHHYVDNHCSSFGGILGINNSNNNYNIPSRGNFSQIFPSINISNLKSNNNNANTASRASSFDHTSNSFDMNLQALDLLTSSRFNSSFSEPSLHSLALLKENPSFAPHGIHQSLNASGDSYKISPPFINGSTEAKRPNNTVMESKPSQAPAKKSRLETRACPPFKVRKEKLGDRITSLQQLVAPFGKTDTASVLMEAIGYIKFLQSQVETLSVPYMKSSSNKSHRAPNRAQSEGDSNEDRKRDLRSRGLCLVPLSCLSYVTSDGGGGVWPHPDYHGCT